MKKIRPTSYTGVSLREFEENDNEVLYQVFIDSRHDLLTAVADWDESQQKAFLCGQFQAQQDQYRNHYPNARFDVIVTEGKVIGNFYLAPVDDELRLVDINLLPRFRNRGIGRALLQDLLNKAEGLNSRVTLHVLQGNPAAHLYKSLGFKDVGCEGMHQRMQWHPPACKTIKGS